MHPPLVSCAHFRIAGACGHLHHRLSLCPTVPCPGRKGHIMKLEDELKVPYVSSEIVEYLKTVFNRNNLLNKEASSAEARLGYMQGCRDVITHLEMIREEKESD